MAKTLKDRQVIYNHTFGNEMGKEVLAELRNFCYATKTTFNENPYQTARNEGRREVFLNILTAMKVEFEETYDYVENNNDY